jgi:hypothetical protein
MNSLNLCSNYVKNTTLSILKFENPKLYKDCFGKISNISYGFCKPCIPLKCKKISTEIFDKIKQVCGNWGMGKKTLPNMSMPKRTVTSGTDFGMAVIVPALFVLGAIIGVISLLPQEENVAPTSSKTNDK